MVAHQEEVTPPESPLAAAESPPQIGRLSLENDDQAGPVPVSRRGRGDHDENPAKRAASSELPRLPGRRTPEGNLKAAGAGRTKAAGRSSPKTTTHAKLSRSRVDTVRRGHQTKQTVVPPRDIDDSPHKAVRESAREMTRDSGYETHPSRSATTQSMQPRITAMTEMPSTAAQVLPHIEKDPKHPDLSQRTGIIQLPAKAKAKYPGLILQPDSSPISQEQLAAEVKGIYAGLVMVEAKCINIDAAQAADTSSQLGQEQWQALIALHRTLLYEHHDFLMATQHPSATPALRNLATKYTMPARMWKHGIHAFLEVLRHRRPESQDYMLAFIYLAYQMMALLFETVPSFIDTWIECLGDLARYRMAIEEDKEAHAQWGAVAARWYSMASDRHPAIGRLNHHLGILERPSLRKLFLYAKALTCVIPFPNARDSLSTLCAPIISDDQAIKNSSQSAEARIVTFHALVFSTPNKTTIEQIATDAVQLWTYLPSAKKRDLGVSLAVTNIATLVDLGNATNPLWQAFITGVTRSIRDARPSAYASPAVPPELDLLPDAENDHMLSSDGTFAIRKVFTYACFNTVVRRYEDSKVLQDVLPFIHIMLAWLQSLVVLGSRLQDSTGTTNTCGTLLGPAVVSWGGLSDLLNSLAPLGSKISARSIEMARQGAFPAPERKEDAKPLSEDFAIRGLVWSQWYFGQGWFDGHTDVDDGRSIETPEMQTARIERVQWLGLYLAFHTEHLRYNVQQKSFWAPVSDKPKLLRNAPSLSSFDHTSLEPASLPPSPTSRTTSSTPTARSEVSDGFTIVSAPKSKKPIRTWASVASKPQPPLLSKPIKVRQDVANVKVVDEDSMDLEM